MTGDDFKAWRTRHGLTQQQVAERIGVTANTVARWERGEIAITMMVENSVRWLEEKLRAESRTKYRRFRPRRRRHIETQIPAPPPPAEQITLTVDAAHWRQLLQLVHPDKHGGSKMANEITAWLLSQGRPH